MKKIFIAGFVFSVLALSVNAVSAYTSTEKELLRSFVNDMVDEKLIKKSKLPKILTHINGDAGTATTTASTTVQFIEEVRTSAAEISVKRGVDLRGVKRFDVTITCSSATTTPCTRETIKLPVIGLLSESAIRQIAKDVMLYRVNFNKYRGQTVTARVEVLNYDNVITQTRTFQYIVPAAPSTPTTPTTPPAATSTPPTAPPTTTTVVPNVKLNKLSNGSVTVHVGINAKAASWRYTVTCSNPVTSPMIFLGACSATGTEKNTTMFTGQQLLTKQLSGQLTGYGTLTAKVEVLSSSGAVLGTATKTINLSTGEVAGAFTDAQSATLSANAAAYSHISTIPNLSVGMSDPGVAAIQRYLNANGFQIGTAAGQSGSVGYESNYFGPATQAALARFQAAKGISPANGAFGPQTRVAMTSN